MAIFKMNRISRVCRILLAFVFVACLAARLSAQELSGTKGGLAGVVTDSSGAAVPGATVAVAGSSDNRKVSTNDTGRWEILDLTPGSYTISVEREGFSKIETKAVSVEINRINNVNLALRPGAVAETVQVDATESFSSCSAATRPFQAPVAAT